VTAGEHQAQQVVAHQAVGLDHGHHLLHWLGYELAPSGGGLLGRAARLSAQDVVGLAPGGHG